MNCYHKDGMSHCSECCEEEHAELYRKHSALAQSLERLEAERLGRKRLAVVVHFVLMLAFCIGSATWFYRAFTEHDILNALSLAFYLGVATFLGLSAWLFLSAAREKLQSALKIREGR